MADIRIRSFDYAQQRSKEHNHVRDLCYRYSFTRIHILTGETFEETPAKHFETLLIRLMEAYGKFHVINTKKEWQHYFRKNEFGLCFDRVWLELENRPCICTICYKSGNSGGVQKCSKNILHFHDKSSLYVPLILHMSTL